MFKKIADAVTDQVEQIGNTIQETIKNHSKGIDTEQFNDPIAEQTDWGPLVPGGTNFRTHKLKKDMRGNVRFKATIGALLFSGIFMLIGLCSLAGLCMVLLDGSFEVGHLFFLLFVAAFGGAGYWMYRNFTKPIVFSFQKGYFFKGRMKAHQNPQQAGLDDWCRLEEIHALQIVSERVRSSSNNGRSRYYRSHELNLIKKDASRLNVVDYGNLERLRTDATVLADTLDVPIWDASREGFSLFR